MHTVSDNATLIKANVCHLSLWRSVQHIGVEKCRPNYLAESEQVPLPATALIASVLLQISNQTNIGIAGIQMRWWNVSAHQNVRIGTVARTAQESLRSIQISFCHWLTQGKMEILLSNEIEAGEWKTQDALKTSLDSLKSLCHQRRGGIGLIWALSVCVREPQLSDCLHVSEG